MTQGTAPIASRYTIARPARGAAIIAIVAIFLVVAGHNARASIVLKSFTATAMPNGAIRVDWETATELDTIAFRLYRSTSAFTTGQVIAIQQAAGNPVTGATYTYTDPAAEVTPGRIYHYRLEELTASGGSSWHGPVSVQVGPLAQRAYLPMIWMSQSGAMF